MASLSDFIEETRGTVAILYGVMFLAVIILIGGAVDFSNHRSQMSASQAALDSAILAVIQSPTLTEVELVATARNVFDENASSLQATVTQFEVVRSEAAINGRVEGDYNTIFLGLFGIPTLPIVRTSVAQRSVRTREIALVLDLSDSMADGDKLQQLKNASTYLINFFEANAERPRDFRVSLVPFNSMVNVGVSNVDEDWLDMDGDSAVAQSIFGQSVDRLALYEELGAEWRGCLMSREGALAYSDDPISLGRVEHLFVPAFSPDLSDTTNRNYIADTVDTNNDLVSLHNFEKYAFGTPDEPVFETSDITQATNRSCLSQEIIPLTSNYNDLRDAVDDFQATLNTNMPEALMWGQRVLSPHAPFEEGRPTTNNFNDKVIIFLTDGLNHLPRRQSSVLESDFTTYGYSALEPFSDVLEDGADTIERIRNTLDSHFSNACDTVKASGTILYVVRLELEDAESNDLLRDCATSPNLYIDVPDADQLTAAFREIGSLIVEIRLTE